MEGNDHQGGNDTITINRRSLFAAFAGLAGATAFTPDPARAVSTSQISQDAHAALQRLYGAQPKAHELGRRTIAILVFPSIIKAGLIIGGQGGNGALVRGGKTVTYGIIRPAGRRPAVQLRIVLHD